MLGPNRRMDNLVLSIKDLLAPKNMEGMEVIAEVTGRLEITINDRIFFDEEDILLLELAIILSRWINQARDDFSTPFYYASMDYEEEPILSFMLRESGTWMIFSEWEKFHDNNEYTLDILLESAQNFLNYLERALKEKFNLDTSKIINT
jgi:hypothetical protein